MAIITIVGAGMMGSAIGMPAAANGHAVRLAGTPLDRDIIDAARERGFHKTLKRPLPASYRFYQFEEIQSALEGADRPDRLPFFPADEPCGGGYSSFLCDLLRPRAC